MTAPTAKSDGVAPPRTRGPLAGVRVIELAHIMAGPVCGLMLADMGADVVKVEKCDGGDDTRRFLPPDIEGQSAAFMMLNRNKRGIALDLKSDGGRAALLRLIDSADILIENYRHDTMQRLGLAADDLLERNPRLVYCEISGFGRTGPLAEHGGFDLVAQGMSGLMSITGNEDDPRPVKCGPPVSDITAGILGALGCLAAYIECQRTGRGQRVDTSLFEGAIIQTFWQSAIALAQAHPTNAEKNIPNPTALGSAHPLNAPYQAFETASGWINVGGANQRNWLRILDVLDAPHLANDVRFETNEARMRHRAELEAELAPHFRTRTCEELCAAFQQVGVPAGPVLDIAAMHAHPQTRARGMVERVTHPIAGDIETIGAPIKFSAHDRETSAPAPLLGEHGHDILREIGMTDAEISALEHAGHLGTPQLPATA